MLLGLALTVAFGIKGDWWLRTLLALGTLMLLVAGIKLGTRTGNGPVSKLANWIIRG